MASSNFRCSFKIELTFDSRANIEELPLSDQRCPLLHFEVKQLRDIEEKKDDLPKNKSMMLDFFQHSKRNTWKQTKKKDGIVTLPLVSQEKDEISVAGIVLDAEPPSLISLKDGSQKKRHLVQKESMCWNMSVVFPPKRTSKREMLRVKIYSFICTCSMLHLD